MELDATFSVTYTHRLRFTRQALDPRNPTLAGVLVEDVAPARVLAFVDRGVLERLPDLPQSLQAYAEHHRRRMAVLAPAQPVAGGEQAKNDQTALESVLGLIQEHRLDRQSYVLVIGGGATLDVVGFAAAIAHRGIRLIRMPTTTLAQADSGVGVKNSINLLGQKNYLGTFAVPWAVINDAAFLEVLSDRDFRCGFAEAVKVALIKDAAFFRQIEELAPRLRQRDMAAALPVLQRSAEIHLRHITQGGDPFETSTARPLDFGHWSAHKIEQLTGFALRHGEAVAIGIALDTVYSALAGMLDAAEASRTLNCLRSLGFVLYDPALADTDALWQGLEEFREHLGGQLTLTLLKGIGQAVDAHQVDRGLVEQAVRRLAS